MPIGGTSIRTATATPAREEASRVGSPAVAQRPHPGRERGRRAAEQRVRSSTNCLLTGRSARSRSYGGSRPVPVDRRRAGDAFGPASPATGSSRTLGAKPVRELRQPASQPRELKRCAPTRPARRRRPLRFRGSARGAVAQPRRQVAASHRAPRVPWRRAPTALPGAPGRASRCRSPDGGRAPAPRPPGNPCAASRSSALSRRRTRARAGAPPRTPPGSGSVAPTAAVSR